MPYRVVRQDSPSSFLECRHPFNHPSANKIEVSHMHRPRCRQTRTKQYPNNALTPLPCPLPIRRLVFHLHQHTFPVVWSSVCELDHGGENLIRQAPEAQKNTVNTSITPANAAAVPAIALSAGAGFLVLSNSLSVLGDGEDEGALVALASGPDTLSGSAAGIERLASSWLPAMMVGLDVVDASITEAPRPCCAVWFWISRRSVILACLGVGASAAPTGCV